MTLSSSTLCSPGLQALLAHGVTARVKDVDHYRTHKGVSVETDYIVEVHGGTFFEPFCIAKTYAQFRALTSDLVDHLESHSSQFSDADRRLAKACRLVAHLIDSQPTEYFGKVSYAYVKNLAQQRQTVVDDVLQQLLEHFPTQLESDDDLGRAIGTCLETFFLTDHCCELQQEQSTMDRSHTLAKRPSDKNMTAASSSSSSSLERAHSKKNKGLLSKVGSGLGTGIATVASGVGSGLSTVTSGVGSGLSTVTSGVGSGLSTVTSGVGTVVKKMDISSVFCATDGEHNKSEAFHTTSPVRSRQQGAGAVTNSKLVPMTTKRRHCDAVEGDAMIMEEMVAAQNVMSGGSPSPLSKQQQQQLAAAMSTSASTTTTSAAKRRRSNQSLLRFVMDNGYLVAAAVLALAIYLKFRARFILFVVDSDIALLGFVGAFVLGSYYPLNSTLPSSTAKEQRAPVMMMDKTRAMMKRTSLHVPGVSSPLGKSTLLASAAVQQELLLSDAAADEEEEEEIGHVLDSPLPMFPAGAKIGSHNNCWSVPEHATFSVRGPKYLDDRKKVASDAFLFPTRGIDLFLTDTCPEHVARLSCVFGGQLRTVPTFVINFRLPWGVLIFYFEIPNKFIPFVRACYEPDFDTSSLPSLQDMSPGERTACRFLQGDLEHKNKTLKIVPVVVDGPWIVKNVVGGKPAIIGTKLPVNYVYAPSTGDNALYLEADLDIAASSAARGILSVTRSYTEILTIDLGFVVQANERDELPEQMLVGCRIHGVDPLTAQQLPLQSSAILSSSDDDDDTESLSSLLS